MPHDRPPEPWHSFLQAIDDEYSEPLTLHCIGGFAIAMSYGLPRPTSDVDCLAVIPAGEIEPLEALVGQRSALHKKHGVYVQYVGEVTVPDDYANRLTEIFPEAYRNVRLMGLEGHDLALSKLERNSPRDREDVKFLARAAPLDPVLLESRYHDELRPYLARPGQHDLTLRLWLEMLREQ